MLMFIEVFLMLCIIAQPQVCALAQPLNVAVQAECGTVDNKTTIFSHIKCAGNCPAYEDLKEERKFRQLGDYCERPLPGTPSANGYLSYEVVLCMVLYDAVQRVCGVEHQEFTKDIQNFSGGFSCDTMIKGVSEPFAENTKLWVTLFKAKLGNVSSCEQACIQDKTISPVCEYIWKANTLTYQAQASSAISAVSDKSPPENPQVNSKGHGKTNRTVTSKDKTLGAKALDDQTSASDPRPSVLNNGSQNTEKVDHKVTPINKSPVHKNVDLAAANGSSTQSGSANDVKNTVEEQAHIKDSNVQNDFKKPEQATVNTGHNDAKKQAHTAGSNAQNDINKQSQGRNSNVQNITKTQEHAKNSNNQSAEVTPSNAEVSLSGYTERTTEAHKYNDSTGKSISSDSKSNTAPQSEHKSSAGDYTSGTDMGNQNEDTEDLDTGVTANTQSGDEDREGGGQREQMLQKTGAQKVEAETGNTAQFNQLGDAADSHFYAYFMTMVVICIIGYLVFHNKQKILALALEGRSRRGTRRRPNTSAYRKLDSNLEEAVTSTGSTSVTHVIY